MLVLAALGCALIIGQPELNPDSIVFATGRQDGNYYALAQALVKRSDRWCVDCSIELRETGGSYDNARLLRTGEADLALIQSDVAYLEYFEGRPYQALAAPYLEPVHIVVRRELGLLRLSDLIAPDRQFRVVIGPGGSGSASHALTILHELEIEGAKLSHEEVSLGEGFERLGKREADVAFVTSAVPIQGVAELAALDAIDLLTVDGDLARRLMRKNPFFSAAEIPYRAYGLRQHVATLGTRTLLVAREDFPKDRIAPLLDTLYQLGGPNPALPFLKDLQPNLGFDDLSIPSHPEALAFHQRHEAMLLRLLVDSRSYLLPIVVLLAPLLVLLCLPRTAYFIHQFVLGRILVLLVTVWLVGSAAMYLLEGPTNSNFRSFGNSALAILHYLFSGFEAKFPRTPPGHVVAILILSLGVAVVTLFTATVVTLLVERAFNVRRIRRKPSVGRALRGHVVLVGWSERVERILRHLRSRDVQPRPTVVVATTTPPRPQEISSKDLRGVWSVTDDPAQEALRRADLATAKVAVVLGESADRRQDWLTTTSALAVGRVAPKVHTVVEVSGRDCCETLEGLRADEIVITGTMGERLISQCTITPGISAVYDELLTFGVGSQEIYLGSVPRWLAGRTFRQTRRRLIDEELIPIGYRSREEGRIWINPHWDDHVLEASGENDGDALVFIADTGRALPGNSRWDKRFWSSPGKSEKETPSEKGTSMSTSPKTRSKASRTIALPYDTREATIGICGWNNEARAVIDQLLESVVATHQKFSVTVIDEPDRLGFTQPGNGELHEHVRFIVGDPTRKRVLENAGLCDFRSLVILADRSSDDTATYSDHRALMIALSATAVNPSLHVIVELLHSKNREHFDQMPTVEVVSVGELAEKLLAQAVVNPGITEVYLELLTATEDSNEVYIVPVPAAWTGRSFRDVYGDLLGAEQPVIPIGYRVPAPGGTGQVVVLNPGSKEQPRNGVPSWKGYELSEDDGLVVIAYEEPDLATLAARSAKKA